MNKLVSITVIFCLFQINAFAESRIRDEQGNTLGYIEEPPQNTSPMEMYQVGQAMQQSKMEADPGYSGAQSFGEGFSDGFNQAGFAYRILKLQQQQQAMEQRDQDFQATMQRTKERLPRLLKEARENDPNFDVYQRLAREVIAEDKKEGGMMEEKLIQITQMENGDVIGFIYQIAKLHPQYIDVKNRIEKQEEQQIEKINEDLKQCFTEGKPNGHFFLSQHFDKRSKHLYLLGVVNGLYEGGKIQKDARKLTMQDLEYDMAAYYLVNKNKLDRPIIDIILEDYEFNKQLEESDNRVF